jgi:hypothetical protein
LFGFKKALGHLSLSKFAVSITCLYKTMPMARLLLQPMALFLPPPLRCPAFVILAGREVEAIMVAPELGLREGDQ